MLPMEFLAPFSDDEEIDFHDQIALDPMTAIFEKPADDERQHLKARRKAEVRQGLRKERGEEEEPRPPSIGGASSQI